MSTVRFEQLARSLAARDRELPERLAGVRTAMADLREHAAQAVGAFVAAARDAGAEHLTDVVVGPLTTDAKHVDCVSFAVSRGRFEAVCVGKPDDRVRLVGPYRLGQPERPCADHPLLDPTAEAAIDELLLQLLAEASRR
jgi:hypothetical protein